MNKRELIAKFEKTLNDEGFHPLYRAAYKECRDLANQLDEPQPLTPEERERAVEVMAGCVTWSEAEAALSALEAAGFVVRRR